MGEAKRKEELDQVTIMSLASVPVDEDDILMGASCIALLGDFYPKKGRIPGTEPGPGAFYPPAEDQLRAYWSYMRRVLPVELVPAVWNRIRCLTEAMANNHDIMVLFKGEETEDGIRFPIKAKLFRRVAATMPVMPNAEGARSITANVFCPHDVIISLAAGPT